jgi:plasmid stabilization system protein ParE
VRILRRSKFIDDLTEAYAYLAERSPSAADRLPDDVEAVADLLAAFPSFGRPRDVLRAGVRPYRLPRFQYIVIYRHEDDTIMFLRLLHGARDIEPDLILP